VADIPALSELALMIVGLMLAIAGAVVLRR